MYPNVRSLKLSKISVLKDPAGDKAFYDYSKQYNMFSLQKKPQDCVVFTGEPRACFFTNVKKTSEYINDSSIVTIEPRYVHNFAYNTNRHLIHCSCTFNPSELPQYENIEFSSSGSRPTSSRMDRNKGELKCVFDNIQNSGIFAFIVEPYLPSLKVTSVYFENMRDALKNLSLKELSMGMSSDYLTAIKFNASYVRIGSRIFGKRD